MNQNMMLADATFSEAMVEKYMDKAIEFGISILIALVIFIIGKYVIKFILKFTKRLFVRSSIDDAVGNFINSLLRVILYGVLIIIICDKVGIQTTSFIALLTSAGLAIGLALQGSLANFAGGVLILIMKPFVLGDYIRTDLGEGEVINIEKTIAGLNDEAAIYIDNDGAINVEYIAKTENNNYNDNIIIK